MAVPWEVPIEKEEKNFFVWLLHSCQLLLGVNLCPVFMNLYFPYAGQGLLFFHWLQRHFEFQLACVAVEGRSNIALNMHAWLQISHPERFLSLLHYASQCAFGNGVCWLLIWQFFSLFAPLKTPTKSHEKCVFLYPFSNMAIKRVFYTGKLYGLTGMTIGRMTKRCMLMTIFAYFPPIQFSSAQDGVCVLRKAHIYIFNYICIPPHLSEVFPNIFFEWYWGQLASLVQFSIQH